MKKPYLSEFGMAVVMFDKDFFWNLFLNTGRVDAYLLLKKADDDISKNKVLIKDD